MRRTVAVIVLSLWVAACGTFQNPLNVTRLSEVESAYGIALAAANGYRQLYRINRCTTARPESASNICARRSIVLRLQSADRQAQVALAAARTFVRNNPTLDASSIISGAALAVGALERIETDSGIR